MRWYLPWLAATLSGAALALSFPKPDLHLLIWVALVPLLLALAGARPSQAWWLGFLAGAIYRGGTLYWLVNTMVQYGGLAAPVAWAAAGGLVLALAAFVGVFAIAAAQLLRTEASAAALLAALWVALEYTTSFPLGGFPWTLVGYAAGRSSLLLQIADLAGVYGLSFLAVYVNVALAGWLARRQRWAIAPWSVAHVEVGLAAILIVMSLVYGGLRLGAAPAIRPLASSQDAENPRAAEPSPAEAATHLSVAVIQGNVPQDLKWDPQARAAIGERHLRLSNQAAAAGAQLIVWPESSIPTPQGLARDPIMRAAISELARDAEVALLVGSVHVEGRGGVVEATNAAFLILDDAGWSQRYDKVRLVPFGEYVPLRRWLPWIDPLVEAVSEFRAGDPKQPLFEHPPSGLPPFGVAICYEIVFPRLVRGQVARGATFLVTITNDAWYGDSSAPYQHFAMARMRAVENRRYLVRAANTGISGIVDPWGRVLLRTELDREAVVTGSIVPRRVVAPYTRWGNVFAWACVVASVALVGLALALGYAPGRNC